MKRKKMSASFVHDGNAIDYVPAADVAVGDVIQREDLIAVAKREIPAGTLGALHPTGVFDIPKNSGAGEDIPAGKLLFWDDTNKVAVKTPAAGQKILGKAVAVAGENDPTVRVRLWQ
jgi:predicted RecA/RadA family phage recombinase